MEEAKKELTLESQLKKNLVTSKKKRKWRWLVIVLTVLVIGGVIASVVFGGKAEAYEFVKVTRKDLKEIVEITGNVEADATIELSFQASGKLDKLNFDVGDSVKKGEIIAALENKDQALNLERSKAQLAAAQADLNARLAGSTAERVKIAEIQVKQAEVNLDKLQVDVANAEEDMKLLTLKFAEDEKKSELVVKDAADKLEFAKKNAANAGAVDQESVKNAENELYNQLLSTSAVLQNSLVNLKSVIVNDGLSALGQDFNRLDYQRTNQAQQKYFQVKNEFDPLYNQIKNNTQSDAATLQKQAELLKTELDEIVLAQKLTIEALSILPPSSTLPSQTIDNLKSSLSVDSNSLNSNVAQLTAKLQQLINAQLGNVSGSDNSLSAVTNAQNFYDQQVQSQAQLKIDHQVSLNDKSTQIKGLKSQIEIQEASIESAKANLADVKAGPRAVDVAASRAQIAAAQIDVRLREQDLEKTLMRAPTNGVLSRRNANVGEQISGAFAANSSVPVFEMISSDKYKIDANIAEVDVGKIQVGDKVTITLDSIGEKDTFQGTITKIDPVSTNIQDVVFYKASVVIDSEDERVKPGMTANVEIVLNEALQALSLPERAVQRDNGNRYVRALKEDGQIEKLDVVTGLRSVSGDIEIKSGLPEGKEVILRTIN